jgi:hypothetical protein
MGNTKNGKMVRHGISDDPNLVASPKSGESIVVPCRDSGSRYRGKVRVLSIIHVNVAYFVFRT